MCAVTWTLKSNTRIRWWIRIRTCHGAHPSPTRVGGALCCLSLSPLIVLGSSLSPHISWLSLTASKGHLSAASCSSCNNPVALVSTPLTYIPVLTYNLNGTDELLTFKKNEQHRKKKRRLENLDPFLCLLQM